MTLDKDRIYQALNFACLLVAGIFSFSFFYIAFSTLGYPYNLEWMEGHTVDIIQRIRDGKSLYVEPTLEYTPYIYTPFYFYVSAFFSYFSGVDFAPARLVSILSTLGNAAILFLWMRKEGAGKVTAFFTAGLFLATYKLSGRWFDVARLDSLYLLLMVSGLYIYYFHQSLRSAIISGVLFALAFYTKQSAILVLFPAFVVAVFLAPRRALITACVAGTLSVLAYALFEYSSHGWFSFFIYDVPAGHSNDWNALAKFWIRDMRECRILLILSFFALFMFCERDKKSFYWYLALLIGFIGSSYASRIHSFGHINVLMPTHYILVLLSGFALQKASEIRHDLKFAIPCLLALQMYWMQYSFDDYIPSKEAKINGEKLIAEIAAIPGDILFSELQYIQSKAGKKIYTVGMAGFDLMRSELKDKNYIKKAYTDKLITDLRDHRFSAVVTGKFMKLREANAYYKLDRTLANLPEYVTGAVSSPILNVLHPIKKPEPPLDFFPLPIQ